MIKNEFKKGQLTYNATDSNTSEKVVALVQKDWKDGYIAFANGEKRWRYFADIELNEQFFSQRIQDITQLDKLEGYVTELNLWRSSGNIFEEIAIEREDHGFYVQHIILDTASTNNGNCWYRTSDTIAGSHHNPKRQIFGGKLKTIEVVWPAKRLNIFITVGG